MCYVCRQGLGKGSEGEGQGYRHFCQHFRPRGGRCFECEKCDLYKGEDEDEVVKRAGERAEREWRVREGWIDGEIGRVKGGGGILGTGKGVEDLGKGGGSGTGGMGTENPGFDSRDGKWSFQKSVDWWVGKVLKC